MGDVPARLVRAAFCRGLRPWRNLQPGGRSGDVRPIQAPRSGHGHLPRAGPDHSRTCQPPDVDLIDPAEDRPGSMIGGVHYAEGVQPAWRRAALSHGKVLLLTGRQLPAASLQQAAGDPWGVRADIADLW